MKPSLRLLYHALEQASHDYAETGSQAAQQRVWELIEEMRHCLDDIEDILFSEEEPDTGELEAIR